MADKVNRKNQSTVDKVFERHRSDVKRNRFLTNKVKVFVLAMISGFVLIAAGFLVSPFSKVKGISVKGNYLLNRDELVELAGLNEQTIYLFVFDSVIENRLLNNPFIGEASVSVSQDGTVEIEVVEKVVLGYRYQKTPEIVFQDGTLSELKNEYSFLYSEVPLIVGFEGDMKDFCHAFEGIPQKRIASVSEIHRYEYSYDPNGIEFVMKDGNRFFASFYSAQVLNQYNGIVSALSEKRACLYADENSGNVYKSLCPEEVLALEELENQQQEEDVE